MGLQYDREQRRTVLSNLVQKAYLAAISDARESFDDADAQVLRKAYEVWLLSDEIELPLTGKTPVSEPK